MGSGRFGNFSSATHTTCLSKLVIYPVRLYFAARAYLLGYNCADEKELQAALRFC